MSKENKDNMPNSEEMSSDESIKKEDIVSDTDNKTEESDVELDNDTENTDKSAEIDETENAENENSNEVSDENKKEKSAKSKKNGKSQIGNKAKKSIKKSFSSQLFKSGAYTTVISIIVIALVIIVNLAFNKLDLSTDMSSGSIYTLSQTTEKIVKNAKDSITIYYMVSEGKETDQIKNALIKYNKISDNVKVVTKDPVVYPGFAKKLGVDDDVSDNDVIVVNNKTGAVKYISNEDMYYTGYSSDGSSSGETLDVEGRVTSAIQYVLSDDNTKMYILQGHDEVTIGDDLTNAISKLNVDTDTLDLVSTGKIPSDCDILLIAGPQSDLMDNEKDLILDYLKKGGDAIIFTEYADTKTPNLDEILDYYGVTLKQGVICETSGKYYQYLNVIIPTVGTSSEITSDISSSSYIIMPNAEGLVKKGSSELRSTVSITELLTTSKGSFLKVDPSDGTSSKESGDLSGPFDVGLSVEEELSGSDKTQLVIYSSADLLSDDYVASSTGLANADLLTNAISSMTKSSVKEASIDVKDLSGATISVPVASQVFLAVIIIILLPGTLLVVGFVVWFYRRRK